MTVYVDETQDYTRIAKARRLRHTHWCHLTADTRDELHDFAKRLGLRRTWFQDHAIRWHYDITPPKRARALQLGAVEIDRHALADIMAKRRTARRTVLLTRPGHTELRFGPYDNHDQADALADGLRAQLDDAIHVPGTTITVVPYDYALPHREPYVTTDPKQLAYGMDAAEADASREAGFPNLYARLQAQLGYEPARDIWLQAAAAYDWLHHDQLPSQD